MGQGGSTLATSVSNGGAIRRSKSSRSRSRNGNRLCSIEGARTFLGEEAFLDQSVEKMQASVSDGDNDKTLFLPDDLLSLIFERLDHGGRNSCSLVCRRWLRVEAQGRHSICFKARSNLTESLPVIFQRFSNLTKIGLKCERGQASIDDEGLFLIGSLCKQLQKIKLKGCKEITDAGVERFALACSSSLRIFSCGSCGFGSSALNAVVEYCIWLEELSVKKLRAFTSEVRFVGPGFVDLGRLRRLSIKHMNNGHLFAPLIASCSQLQTLIIFKVSGNWDRLLELVIEDLHHLKELRLEKIQLGDRGLEAVGNKCRNLQVFFIAKAPECSNRGITAVANGCPLLRKLHVDGSYSGKIGDKGLMKIGEKCRELKELVLIGLNATSSSFVMCNALERLAVWNSETFGDVELGCIATKCKALKKMCIKCCPISDKGLEALVDGCPSLCKIKIKKCTRVTISAAAHLQHHSRLVLSLEHAAAADVDDDMSLLEGDVAATERSPPLIARVLTAAWWKRR